MTLKSESQLTQALQYTLFEQLKSGFHKIR